MSTRMADPFWVVGAPRSGTTYLVEVLNRHRDVFLTVETRVMVFASRILNRVGRNDSVLHTGAEQMLSVMRAELPRVIAAFYRELGAEPGQRWGDKYPHYADGLQEPECLDTIQSLFPASQYIHIIRDGRAAAASFRDKGWGDGTLEYAVDIWARHVSHARSFGCRVGPGRYLEVRYEDLVSDGPSVLHRVLQFLGLGPSAEVDEMLAEQACRRTPFSTPATEHQRVGQITWHERFSADDLVYVERQLADLLVEFRYEPPEWRRRLMKSLWHR